MLKGRHLCINEWSIDGKPGIVELSDIRPLLYDREPVLISHDEIAWWFMDKPQKKIDERYSVCNIRVPGIVAEGAVNPYNKKYRMVDGSHRMAKMLLETKIRESLFYVITAKELYERVREYDG